MHGIADRFQQWLKPWSEKRNVPVLEAPKGNRTIDQPNKITTIFGRKISKLHHGKLQTEIEHMDLANRRRGERPVSER